LAKKEEVYRGIKIAGFALFIPSLLVAGPLAGYFSASFLEKHFRLPGYTTLFFMAGGLFAALLETFKIIKKMLRIGEKL
jgi:hypothetical protein